MLYAFLTFIALQCVGDLIADALSLPVPGMVIGLVLLLCGLGVRCWRIGTQRAVPDALNRTARGLHDNFGLLFVPAGAGVVANLGRLAADGLALLVAVLISTAATIAVTALIATWRARPVPAPSPVPAE